MHHKQVAAVLKDSRYALSIFTDAEIDTLTHRVELKEHRGQQKPYVRCLVRDNDVQLKPEEAVRQLYLARLLDSYAYPKKRMRVEHPVAFGRETKKADIVIFDKDRPTVEYIVIELKRPKFQDGKRQLRSYCNATGAPIGVWTNGGQIETYQRLDPNYFEPIGDIPRADQSLEDVIRQRFTLRDLIVKDKLINDRRSLKDLILDMEDEVLANAGVDVFEEVFKLIFTKLFDEYESRGDKRVIDYHLNQNLKPAERADFQKVKEALETLDDNDFRVMGFRNSGQSETELKRKIQKLFDTAKTQWPGVFADDAKLTLSPSHFAICVASLQDIKLFNSNLQVIDEAFEYLVNKSARGEKGQYFTPRHVIDMCVKMLNPKPGEYMIDTAAGSCGFTVHTIFWLTGHLFTNDDIPEQEKENVLKVFGIDFDERAVRVARTLNLIAGDGETNVLHLNTLDYDRWQETFDDRNWLDTYGKGLKRLEKLKARRDSNEEFQFDILMANPPFAGDIKESRILHKYDLGYKANGKSHSKLGRDILFIERNLDFLKPGGRMAIVLPQGRFNNSSDGHIRDYIANKARILAVVGLHGNTFKPHTGTKTSVLFLQKWNDNPQAGERCPRTDNYPIFFAASQQGGKNNSGEYLYVTEADGSPKLDGHGHLIVAHDLHNQGGELPDGIAEGFVAYAKRHGFSFWAED